MKLKKYIVKVEEVVIDKMKETYGTVLNVSKTETFIVEIQKEVSWRFYHLH